MNAILTRLAAAALMLGAGAASAGTLDTVQVARPARLRLQSGPRRLRAAGRSGRLQGPRRRRMPRPRGGDLQRSRQGQISADQRQGPSDHPRLGRDRRADPKHHLDDVARDRRHVLHRRQLLRRPGVHRAQEARRRQRAEARRRLGLRAAGHDDRTQSRRFFPRPRPQVRAGGFRDRRRDGEGLR